MLARDLGSWERVGRTEWLRDEWHDLREVEGLVHLVARIIAGREARVGEIDHALLAEPRIRDVVGREDPVQGLSLGHHVRDRVAIAHRKLLGAVDELNAHALRLLGAPPREKGKHDVLAAHPRLELSGEHHASLPRHREVHVAGRPPEAERRRAHSVSKRAVRAVRATMRVGAGDQRTRHDKPLLREIEMEDPIARRRVIGTLDPVALRELPPDLGLLVVGLTAVEHEVVVGDRDLPRR